jgi:hypothetical protein
VDEPRPLPGWLVAVALVVLLVPIWAFPLFPSQDGPTHVENARILLDYARPDQPALRDFYERSLDPVPNWFSHLFLAAVLPIAGPVGADKLLLTFYVLALPLAFRYALTARRPDAGRRMLLVLPFVYNHFLHLGFYNQAFSAVLFCVVMGFWLRHEARGGLRETLGLTLLLLWLYFCHAIGLVLAVVGLAVLAGTASALQLRTDPRAAVRRLLVAGAASAPALWLLARFLRSRGEVAYEPGATLPERLWELVRLKELVSYDPREAWFSTALAVFLLGAVAALVVAKARRRDWRRDDALLLVGAAIAGIYFTARVTVVNNPGSSPGGGTTHDRVSLFVFLSLLLWIAVQPLGRRAERALVALALTTAVGLLVVRLPRYAELNEYLAEYVSLGARLPRDAVVFPIGFAPYGAREDGSALSSRTLPFLHAAAWIAAERGVVDLLNYEADLGYFPVRFRPGANPYRLMRTGLETVPPCVSLNRYDRLAPRPMDFVLVWAARSADRAHPCVQAIFRHLEERFDLVATSTPRGLSRLYRRKASLGRTVTAPRQP